MGCVRVIFRPKQQKWIVIKDTEDPEVEVLAELTVPKPPDIPDWLWASILASVHFELVHHVNQIIDSYCCPCKKKD